MEIQWSLVIFTLLTGMGAGVFAFIASADLLGKMKETRQTGAAIALGLIVIGGIASVFHLAHPERVLSVLSKLLNTSVGREFVLIGVVVILIAAYIMIIRKESPDSKRKGVAIAGIIFSVLLAFEIGATYVLIGQPAWNTYLLPLAYLASAAVLGIFGGYVIISKKGSEQEQNLISGINKIALLAIILEAIIVLTYYSHLNTSLYMDIAAFNAGPGFMMFWIGVIIVGIIVPFALTIWFTKNKKNSTQIASIALTCTVVGGLAFRAVMYVLGGGYPLHL